MILNMSLRVFLFVLIINCATSRNLPRYTDLDEEDRQLFRAAYETPAYNYDQYQEPDDLPIGKLDLAKDGMWALKAKIKELKAFDKALAASMLSTKLKLKDILDNHMIIKNHHHTETYENHKPAYGYQAPSYPQHEHQYPGPQYPGPQYPAPQYGHDPYYGH